VQLLPEMVAAERLHSVEVLMAVLAPGGTAERPHSHFRPTDGAKEVAAREALCRLPQTPSLAAGSLAEMATAEMERQEGEVVEGRVACTEDFFTYAFLAALWLLTVISIYRVPTAEMVEGGEIRLALHGVAQARAARVVAAGQEETEGW
jgi:hypothetical protein